MVMRNIVAANPAPSGMRSYLFDENNRILPVDRWE
jgi:hypothetical protein